MVATTPLTHDSEQQHALQALAAGLRALAQLVHLAGGLLVSQLISRTPYAVGEVLLSAHVPAIFRPGAPAAVDVPDPTPAQVVGELARHLGAAVHVDVRGIPDAAPASTGNPLAGWFSPRRDRDVVVCTWPGQVTVRLELHGIFEQPPADRHYIELLDGLREAAAATRPLPPVSAVMVDGTAEVGSVPGYALLGYLQDRRPFPGQHVECDGTCAVDPAANCPRIPDGAWSARIVAAATEQLRADVGRLIDLDGDLMARGAAAYVAAAPLACCAHPAHPDAECPACGCAGPLPAVDPTGAE